VDCTSKLEYSRNAGSMIPYYLDIFRLKPKLAVLVYSGDVDIMTVPFAITQPCLVDLQGNKMRNWSPWFVNGATAGYWEVYDTYSYATIKGAGHEVPGYQPLNAFNMFTRWISKQNLEVEEAAPSSRAGLEAVSRPMNQGMRLREMLIQP